MNSMVGRLFIFNLCRLTGAIAVVIIGLYSVLTLLEDIGDISQDGFGVLLRDFFLKLPEIIYLVLPATCAIGAAVGITLLDSRGELILIRLMGVSIKRIIAWIATAAVAWMLLHAFVGEFLLTKSAEAERRIEGKRQGSLASADSVWMRTEEGFASVGIIADEGKQLYDIWIFEAPDDAGLTKVVHAQRAQPREGAWQLVDLQVARDSPDGWKFSAADNEIWSDGPSPELIDALAIRPRYLTLGRLFEVKRELTKLGQSVLVYDLVLWSRLADSLAIIFLMIAGLLCANLRGSSRSSSPRVAGVLALTVMFIYSYSSQLIREVVIGNDWPAVIGAFLPLAIFIAAALVFAKLSLREK